MGLAGRCETHVDRTDAYCHPRYLVKNVIYEGQNNNKAFGKYFLQCPASIPNVVFIDLGYDRKYRTGQTPVWCNTLYRRDYKSGYESGRIWRHIC